MALKRFAFSSYFQNLGGLHCRHSWIRRGSFLVAFFWVCLSQQPGIAQTITDSSAPAFLRVADNVVMAPELRADLIVSDVRLRDLGVLKQAQVAVENVSGAPYTLEYKFQWTDDDGFQTGTTRTWHRFVLAPGQRELISSTGQVPSASNVVFSLRLPDDYFLNRDDEPPWREQESTIPPPPYEPRGDDRHELPFR